MFTWDIKTKQEAKRDLLSVPMLETISLMLFSRCISISQNLTVCRSCRIQFLPHFVYPYEKTMVCPIFFH